MHGGDCQKAIGSIARRNNSNICRGIPRQVSLPSHLEPGLEVAGISNAIEQPVYRSGHDDLAPQLRQIARLANKLNSSCFVLLEAMRNQVLPPGCCEQARGNPGCKGFTDPGKHWRPQPEGIACRRVSIVGKAIKNQVAASQNAQVVEIRNTTHESQAFRGYPLHACMQA